MTSVSYATDIQAIFDNNCVSCHGNRGSGGLDLRASMSFAALVGVVSQGYAPALRVAAGDTTRSVLYGKVVNSGQYGGPMPPNGGPIPKSDRDKLGRWILDGARNN